MQKYISSPTNKATMYRVVFHNPNNSNTKADFGFCLSNKKNYYDPGAMMEERFLHVSERVGSFNVYKIAGKIVQEFSQYAYNLCQFIERSHSLMIENMVVDFLKDEYGNIFFINVKSFKLVHAQMYNELA